MIWQLKEKVVERLPVVCLSLLLVLVEQVQEKCLAVCHIYLIISQVG